MFHEGTMLLVAIWEGNIVQKTNSDGMVND
jgi:hypothetical protein